MRTLFNRIAENSPTRPRSASNQLWRNTQETNISDHNQSPEKMLEKSVASLASRDHMPGWFNQVPVATGIVDPFADGGRRIDLVHLADQTARLVELKWHSDTPVSALFEVLEYGLAYLLARIRRLEFDLGGQALMQDRVTEVRLEVVGPRAFYAVGHNPQLFKAIDKALRQLVAERSDEISMSLDALAFPPWFDRVPFESGKEVKDKCATSVFTDEGRRVCEAFEQLTSAPSSRSPRFLDGVPGTYIENLLDGAAGNEIGSGKFDHPDSSAALAVNTFGFFLHRPAELPALPGLEDAGWPARSLRLEEEVRFPWRGGRHPVLDFVLTTPEAVVGIECKRLEPFRGGPKAVFFENVLAPRMGKPHGGLSASSRPPT